MISILIIKGGSETIIGCNNRLTFITCNERKKKKKKATRSIMFNIRNFELDDSLKLITWRTLK